MRNNLRINGERLCGRLDQLAQIGRIAGEGVCRLALSDEDKQGRDLVVNWMRELGLSVRIDKIGNVVGVRPGLEDGPPVMTGSHIDSVRTGGRYDGVLGVLAGLEVIANLRWAGEGSGAPNCVLRRSVLSPEPATQSVSGRGGLALFARIYEFAMDRSKSARGPAK
jgi:beta-ureidopropionase / N-carbamoyl-L-amino-acid hydrolase